MRRTAGPAAIPTVSKGAEDQSHRRRPPGPPHLVVGSAGRSSWETGLQAVRFKIMGRRARGEGHAEVAWNDRRRGRGVKTGKLRPIRRGASNLPRTNEPTYCTYENVTYAEELSRFPHCSNRSPLVTHYATRNTLCKVNKFLHTTCSASYPTMVQRRPNATLGG